MTKDLDKKDIVAKRNFILETFLPADVRLRISGDYTKNVADEEETEDEDEETSEDTSRSSRNRYCNKEDKDASIFKIKAKRADKKTLDFNYDIVNTSQDLREFTEKLKDTPVRKYGILLYGVSGGGKSLYAKMLASELNMPYIIFKASDLLDKYLGETEQNIKRAFSSARKQKALLVLDEADSFLFDRTKARNDYQVAPVNELLTQMEDFEYPFVMTTNLKDKLDKASVRRFLFKIQYDYLTEAQVKIAVAKFFGKKCELSESQLSSLKYLCPCDFALTKQKLDILYNKKYTRDLVFEYLTLEQNDKNIETTNSSITI